MGGTREERKRADSKFKECIEDEGYPLAANLYSTAVRFGGRPGTGFAFQWGYGHKNFFDYRNLSSREEAEAMEKIDGFNCLSRVRNMTESESSARDVCEMVNSSGTL